MRSVSSAHLQRHTPGQNRAPLGQYRLSAAPHARAVPSRESRASTSREHERQPRPGTRRRMAGRCTMPQRLQTQWRPPSTNCTWQLT
eukprot:1697610-Rhodomonas_salina.2